MATQPASHSGGPPPAQPFSGLSYIFLFLFASIVVLAIAQVQEATQYINYILLIILLGLLLHRMGGVTFAK